MSKSKSIIFSITGIIIVSLFLIVYTFGYVLVKIKGNENSILSSLISKKVSVAYKEISNTSNGETISPGYEFVKVFTATNDGNVEVNYHIYLDNVENEFVRVQDITYILYRSELNGTIDTSNLSDNNIVATGTFPTTDAYIKFNEEIETPNNHYTYALKINYAKTTDSQDEDDGHIFSFRVQLHVEFINPFSSNTNLLSYNIINNAVNTASETSTIYSPSPLTQPAQEISGENERVLSLASDDYGTSYYYRGNVEDNYVEFNNMCWRIIRIEGDGSVKMTLAAQKKCSEIIDSDTATAFIGYGNYGYSYDYVTESNGAQSSLKYLANYVNGSYSTSSSMKTQLDAWLESSGLDTTKLKQDNWCLGNTIDAYNTSTGAQYFDDDKGGLIYWNFSFSYDVNIRLYRGSNNYSTLKCSGTNYETHSSYIGTLTADEAVFAGGKAWTTNTNYYLTDNANGFWWTLSLAEYNSGLGADYPYSINADDGSVFSDIPLTNNCSLRPAVTLNSYTEISGGIGTQTDPYIIN